jgi:hypothetical protein
MSDAPTSRNIPEPMQREIRRRCGFGCVVCGLPLYEYEHLLGWANVKRHVAEEITLLCDRHHREKTAGLLPLDRVKEYDANPFNFRVGVSRPYTLHYQGAECEILLGSCKFTARDAGESAVLAPFVIDGLAMLGFELSDSHLLLNLHLFNEDNELILLISRNQLIYSPYPWDIRLIRRNLVIRTAKGRFLIDIDFQPPNKVVVKRGRFLRNGVEVDVTPDFFLLVNTKVLFSELWINNMPVGISIGSPTPPGPGGINIGQVPRPGVDRAEALKWAKEQIKQSRKA